MTVATPNPATAVEADGDVVARALGEPLRWRIIGLLAGEQLCVGHLAEQLGVPQPLVSHHLKVLRAAELVQAQRYRYWTYYRLRPAALEALADQLWLLARAGPAATACRRLAPAATAPPSPTAHASPPAQPTRGGPPMPSSDRQLDPTSRQTFARAIASLAEEFRGIFSLETVERYVDESIDQMTGARVVDFIPLFVHRFARERLRALAQAEGAIVKDVPEVLFVCVHNAGRSQMAAALLDHHAQGRVHVRSAGSDPADQINPAVVAAMAEWGIDLSREFPKPLTDEVVQAADAVITMGCGDACPVYPGKRYLDWELEDPAGKTVEQVRAIRDELDRRVRALLAELTPTVGDIRIEPLVAEDWPEVAAIYAQGIASGNATFETAPPTWERWDQGHLPGHRLVARAGDGQVVAWAALAPVSDRCAYAGVAEGSIYVAERARGLGVGRRLLTALVERAEEAGIWTVQTGIFPENTASVELHRRCGFRVVGVRERLGQLHGRWRDVLLLERRSTRY
jgi:L-amino acid N-acyltransferase YncA/protein-tyrosine-phosphatase/DNA-binding transcriptional ArsR family regulator